MLVSYKYLLSLLLLLTHLYLLYIIKEFGSKTITLPLEKDKLVVKLQVWDTTGINKLFYFKIFFILFLYNFINIIN